MLYFARRYVVPSRGAAYPSGKCSREFAHYATGSHLRADANACAQRRRAAPALLPPAPAPAPSPTPVSAPASTPAPPTPPPPVSMSNSPAQIPRALASSWRMRDTWRCPGGRVARPAQCTMHDGNTSIAMVYHWTMRPWSRCWTRVKRCTRSYTNTAPLRTCRPCVHQTCTLRQTFLRRRRHRTRIYGDTQ